MGISKYNSEGYHDPTAHEAVRNAIRYFTEGCKETTEG